MKKLGIISIMFLGTLWATAQSVVEMAKLSINTSYDEFGPSFYEDGLIINSNRKSSIQKTVVELDENGNENFLNELYYVSFKKDSIHNSISLMEINDLNIHNGPAVSSNSLLVVAHPQLVGVKKKRKQYGNVGLFFHSKNKEGKWSQPVPFKYNSTEYNLSHPALSADGKTLFFVSDDKQGYGGMDIWKSVRLSGGEWSQPENLGSDVNTEHNEVFPTMNSKSILYFSSNRPETLGGYDIFYFNTIKKKLTRLKVPFNSEKDDYSYITNDGGKSGFISSNRDGSDDVFYFKRKVILSQSCQKSRKKSNCFIFEDRKNIPEGSKIGYQWDFGDGNIVYKERVKHCFTEPGDYQVQMSIIDSTTGILEKAGEKLYVEVEPSTMFYFKKEALGERSLLNIHSENSPLENSVVDEIFWRVDNTVLYDLESFEMPSDLPGRYAVESHLLLNDTMIYCIADTIEIHPKNGTEPLSYHLVYDRPESMLTESMKSDLRSQINSKSSLSVTLDVPSAIYSNDGWKSKMKTSFEAEFNKELKFKLVKNAKAIILRLDE